MVSISQLKKAKRGPTTIFLESYIWPTEVRITKGMWSSTLLLFNATTVIISIGYKKKKKMTSLTNILNAVVEFLGSYTTLTLKILLAFKTIEFTWAICLCLPMWILRPQPQLTIVLTPSKKRCLASLKWLFLSFIQS